MVHFDLVMPLLTVSSFTILAAWFMIQAQHPDSPGKQSSGVSLIQGAAAATSHAISTDNLRLSLAPFNLARLSSNYELVRDLATLFGASITIQFGLLGLHREYHGKKLQRSSDYMRHWFSNLEATDIKLNEFLDSLEADGQMAPTDWKLFNIYHSQYTELKRSADGLDQLSRLQSKILVELCKQSAAASPQHGGDEPRPIELLHNVLNFFENVGLDIKNNVADPDYLKEYFYSTVVDYYELFRKYIEYSQFRHNSRQTLCNFVYLAQTWEREGVRPIIPRICIRPLVITKADIAAVRDHQDGDLSPPSHS